MPTIDIPAVLTELIDTQETVQLSIAGLDNLLRLDFSAEEKVEMQRLLDIYHQIDGTLVTLLTEMGQLATLGYPTLPRLDVTPSMATTLDREAHETVFGRGLFFATTLAVAANITFSPPEKKNAPEGLSPPSVHGEPFAFSPPEKKDVPEE